MVCKRLPQSRGKRTDRVWVRAASAPNRVDDGVHEARPSQRGSAEPHCMSRARKCPMLCLNSQAFHIGVSVCTQTNACSVTQSSRARKWVTVGLGHCKQQHRNLYPVRHEEVQLASAQPPETWSSGNFTRAVPVIWLGL